MWKKVALGLAVLLFALAAVNIAFPPFNFVAAGLALWVLTLLLP